MGESPTEFNDDPTNTPTIEQEILMNINWGDFFRHFAAQVIGAMITAGIGAAVHFNYNDFGVLAPFVVSGVGTLAALATTAWNTYEKKLEG